MANPSSSRSSTNATLIFSTWRIPCSGLSKFTARPPSSTTTSCWWKCHYSRHARLISPALRRGSGNSGIIRTKPLCVCTITESCLINGFSAGKTESSFMPNISIAPSRTISVLSGQVPISSSLLKKWSTSSSILQKGAWPFRVRKI